MLEVFAGEAFFLMEGAPSRIHRASTTFFKGNYIGKSIDSLG